MKPIRNTKFEQVMVPKGTKAKILKLADKLAAEKGLPRIAQAHAAAIAVTEALERRQ